MTENATYQETKDAIVALNAAIRSLPAIKSGETNLERLVVQMGALDPAVVRPGSAHLDSLRQRLVEAARTLDDFRVSKRDLRDAPWLMWGVSEPLVALPGLLQSVEAQALQSYRAATSLIDAWLMHFTPTGASGDAGGPAIRRVLAGNVHHRLSLWRDADRSLRLFDASSGPGMVADKILSVADPVGSVLERAGLDDPSRAVGGYLRAVFLRTVEKALSGPPDADHLARLTDFLILDGKLRFREPAAMHLVAKVLLAPWSRNQSAPQESHRIATRNFLLNHLGDPRLNPKHWPDRNSVETKLMLRWMARASFRAFFDLIDETASDEHFQERKAFWSAYLERNRVDDVWLALGSQIHSSAKSVRDLNGAYGRLRGTAGSDAILLLKIGNIVLCEWSSVGKLRAWQSDWKNAPGLGQFEYTRQDVDGKGLPFPVTATNKTGAPDGNGLIHFGGEIGRWQSSAAELIRRKTGVTIDPGAWMAK